MFAAAEFLGIPVTAIISAIVLAVYLQQQEEKKKAAERAAREEADRANREAIERARTPIFVSIGYRKRLLSPFKISATKNIIKYFFCETLDYRLMNESDASQTFEKGSIRVVDAKNSISFDWPLLPTTIATVYATSEDLTAIDIEFKAPALMEFSEATRDRYHGAAEEECQKVSAFVIEVTEEMLRRAGAKNAPDEESGEEDDSSCDSIDLSDAYTELGLDNTAQWQDVRSAYRSLCLKYHPDSLASQDLPPHLIELATRKFESITLAYQKIKAQREAEIDD